MIISNYYLVRRLGVEGYKNSHLPCKSVSMLVELIMDKVIRLSYFIMGLKCLIDQFSNN